MGWNHFGLTSRLASFVLGDDFAHAVPLHPDVGQGFAQLGHIVDVLQAVIDKEWFIALTAAATITLGTTPGTLTYPFL